MHLSLTLITAGLVVGFLVGLTGMGGGALMTPILIMFFGMAPLAAVSSDLVASLFMRPVGAVVHFRRGTVDTRLVRWLVVGAVPAAVVGVLVLKTLGDGPRLQHDIKIFLGVALLLTVVSMSVKSWLARRRPEDARPISVRPVLTVAIGVAGGVAVGMTSVGAGSLVTGMLLLAYPRLRASQLVGTDLVQAIPVVGAAALGHCLFGDVQVQIAGSLLIGAIPAVYAGARLSARGSNRFIRPTLAVVLAASGLKLIDAPTWFTMSVCATAVVAMTIRWIYRTTIQSRAAASAPTTTLAMDDGALEFAGSHGYVDRGV
jgi:uncharacterized membrane protein YfcA